MDLLYTWLLRCFASRRMSPSASSSSQLVWSQTYRCDLPSSVALAGPLSEVCRVSAFFLSRSCTTWKEHWLATLDGHLTSLCSSAVRASRSPQRPEPFECRLVPARERCALWNGGRACCCAGEIALLDVDVSEDQDQELDADAFIYLSIYLHICIGL